MKTRAQVRSLLAFRQERLRIGFAARGRTGMTLIEYLIAGLIMTMFGAGLFTLIRTSYDSQYELMNENTANGEARQVVDTFADKLRGAASITAASASDITFTDSTGTSYRYWKSSDKLVYSVNGSPSGGNQILKDVQSLTLIYQTWNGTSWSSVTSVSGSALSTVAAIDISATCAVGNNSRSVKSSVRLRQIMRF